MEREAVTHVDRHTTDSRLISRLPIQPQQLNLIRRNTPAEPTLDSLTAQFISFRKASLERCFRIFAIKPTKMYWASFSPSQIAIVWPALRACQTMYAPEVDQRLNNI